MSINTWGQFLIALVTDIFSKPYVNCMQRSYACETLHRALKAPQSQRKLPFAVCMSMQAVPIECLALLCNKSRMYL